MEEERTFSIDERKAFFVNKWRKDHIALLVLLALVPVVIIAASVLTHQLSFITTVPAVMLTGYGWQNNRMMAYVEECIYGKRDKQ